MQALDQRGFTASDALAVGLRPISCTEQLPLELQANQFARTGPGILFPWPSVTDPDVIVWQFRPDSPMVNEDGDSVKYVFGSGQTPPVGLIRAGTDPTGPVFIVEGSFQSRMAARYAAPETTVISIAGCWNFGSDGIPRALPIVEGRPVLICLDADAGTNSHVYAAGTRLGEVCRTEGATAVNFIHLAASGNAGLDDVLAEHDPDRRSVILANLIRNAKPKPAPTKPREKARSSGPVGHWAKYFNDRSLLVETLAIDVVTMAPALVTAQEGNIAFYTDGVYAWTPDGLSDHISRLTGEMHRASHVETTRQKVAQILRDTGRVERPATEPVVCVGNGMLNLKSGELAPWSPEAMATRKIQVPYNPEMETPVYDAWVKSLGLESQIQDLEEITSLMLDPSRPPNRALFLFGDPRTGKGTWARLMKAMVGEAMTSSVTLHQLAENRFASANLHGKVLNIAADMSADIVNDVSIFKMATGEDLITADRKHGRQFQVLNRALFVLIANEIPPVSETSDAYTGRIKPFKFDRSFAKSGENPKIEKALMGELPGILARWVTAWRRLDDRQGRYLETAGEVKDEFVTGTNQVALWARDHVTVYAGDVAAVAGIDTAEGKLFPIKYSTTAREAYQSYARWADENGRAKLGSQKFGVKLRHLPGVREIRRADANKSRALNITLRDVEVYQRGMSPMVRNP